MDALEKILAIIKLPLKFIVGIAIFAGSLFILPDKVLQSLRLTSFISMWGTYIGIAFYGASILLLVNIIAYGSKKVFQSIEHNRKAAQHKIESMRLAEKVKNKIQTLDPHEKAVIREFIIQSKNTIEIPIDHHVVSGLLSSGVIQVVSKYAQRNLLIGLMTSVCLSEAAKNLIFSNPEIIGIPNREPTEEERREIGAARPDFIRQIERFNSLYRR